MPLHLNIQSKMKFKIELHLNSVVIMYKYCKKIINIFVVIPTLNFFVVFRIFRLTFVKTIYNQNGNIVYISLKH